MSEASVDVCLIAGLYHPILGGAGERFRRYMPGLTQRGFKMSVITILKNDLPADEWIEGIPVHRISMTDQHPGQIVNAAVRYFEEIDQWPQVALVEAPLTSRMVPALLKLRMKRVRVVLVLTMVGTVYRGADWKLRLRRKLFFQVTNQLANCVVASSTIMKEWLIEEGFAADRIEIITNGVDTLRFQPTRSPEQRLALRQELNLPLAGAIVLYVGMICQRKGIDYLLKAWEQIAVVCPDACLCLVGPRRIEAAHDVAFLEKIDRMLPTLIGADRIVWAGEVANVERYMQAANVFVFPSRREGMGNVVMEAMASGLPCVVTPFIGFPTEFGQAGQEYLLASFDTASLSQQVLALLQNESKQAAIGLAGRQHIEAHLDVETSLDQLAAVFSQSIGRGDGAAPR